MVRNTNDIHITLRQLDFFLHGDKWVYAHLGISVLGWDYRFQPVDF